MISQLYILRKGFCFLLFFSFYCGALKIQTRIITTCVRGLPQVNCKEHGIQWWGVLMDAQRCRVNSIKHRHPIHTCIGCLWYQVLLLVFPCAKRTSQGHSALNPWSYQHTLQNLSSDPVALGGGPGWETPNNVYILLNVKGIVGSSVYFFVLFKVNFLSLVLILKWSN